MYDLKTIITRLFYISMPLLVTGCVNVEPRDRNFLAKENMVSDPYELPAAFKAHVFDSREGTQSGSVFIGGGCGCN
jgi:hypothetical protein